MQTLTQALLTVFVFCGVLGYGLRDRSALPAMAGGGTELPILMYHSLLRDDAMQGDYVLSPETFREDMEYLRSHGYQTVVVSDLIDFVHKGKPLPEKPVMVTFDDGFFNNYYYAYPILKELGMRAVISVIGSQTELFTDSGQENAYWSYLTLERLREMRDSGVFEVQNHSWDLHTTGERQGCLRKRGEDEDSYRSFFTEDAARVQRLLIEAGLPAPSCYTYPFGACSRESEALVQSLGFRCSLGCEEGMNELTGDPSCLYQMKRWNRPSGLSTEAMMTKAGI